MIDFKSRTAFDSPTLFDNQILTVREASAVLKCSTKNLYYLIRTTDIPHKQFGRQYRFFLPELVNWIKRGG